jgi:hypothetical protein
MGEVAQGVGPCPNSSNAKKKKKFVWLSWFMCSTQLAMSTDTAGFPICKLEAF